MSSRLGRPAVRRVIEALAAHGLEDRIVELEETARTAEHAATALGVAVGAIVKSLVFVIGAQPVVALVAGDRRCSVEALPPLLGLDGAVARARPDLVKAATGFTIGGVAPLGFPSPLPVAIDASLARFSDLYAAAGHPHCVFRTAFAELQRLSGGRPSPAIAAD
jgi:prolyl-tRNA editing enzyme YbaK/EbsC (Cys-tRNA(Pro) deacylase)